MISLVVVLTVALAAVVFALQNSSPVVLSLFAWKFNASLAVVILSAFSLGVLTGAAALLPSFLRRIFHISAQNKRIKELSRSFPDPSSRR